MKTVFALLILCVGMLSPPALAARFDHFNVVVRDLEQTITEMEAIGFKVKRGKPHGNGILNAFIKMKDRTYIEFISVNDPTDELAKYFAKVLLEKGETSVFVAFEKSPLADTKDMFLDRGKYFSTLGYSLQHALRAYFLIDYHLPPDDSAYVDHKNGVVGTASLRGLPLPALQELDSQFLPLDSRLQIDASATALISRVIFERQCMSSMKFESFDKFGIRFTTEAECLN